MSDNDPMGPSEPLPVDVPLPAALASSSPLSGTPSAVASASVAASAAPVESVDAAAPDWRGLAAKGQLREAYAIVDASGFEAECERAGARELLELSDSTLLAGRTDRASTALLAVRRKLLLFPTILALEGFRSPNPSPHELFPNPTGARQRQSASEWGPGSCTAQVGLLPARCSSPRSRGRRRHRPVCV